MTVNTQRVHLFPPGGTARPTLSKEDRRRLRQLLPGHAPDVHRGGQLACQVLVPQQAPQRAADARSCQNIRGWRHFQRPDEGVP